MRSKLQNKRSETLLLRALRSQRDRRRASFSPDRIPTFAGLSLAGLFADRAGLDAFVERDELAGNMEACHAIG